MNKKLELQDCLQTYPRSRVKGNELEDSNVKGSPKDPSIKSTTQIDSYGNTFGWKRFSKEIAKGDQKLNYYLHKTSKLYYKVKMILVLTLKFLIKFFWL